MASRSPFSEVKVHAALQMHRLGAPEVERPLQADTSELVQSQLKTYSDWISSQCSGDWPGAVVFLTYGRKRPTISTMMGVKETL